MTCAGILLTGGASRRMGTDKAALVVDGEMLAVRAARELGAVCAPVIEVGPGLAGIPATREEPAGAGPLAALLAGADALATTGPVVLFACDLPFVDRALLARLVDAPGVTTVVPVVAGRAQYVCARYGPAFLTAARRVYADGARSLHAAVAAAADCVELDEQVWRAVAPAHAFADLDTPDDLRRLGLS